MQAANGPRDVVAGLRHWTIEEALPFWATTGFDFRRGGFHERLLMDGTPDVAAHKRLRVQARQIYVFSHAAALGWFPDGTAIALRAFDYMIDRAQSPDGLPGFVQLLSPDGSVSDATRDTYDHAFVVLACAWLAHASGDAQVRGVLDTTMDFIDAALAMSDGGFREAVPSRPGRRQNPHMHMFEAMLALHETHARADGLERAAVIAGLLEERFIDPATGLLCEHFTDTWEPQSGAAGTSVEPGHAAEWSWLLRRHERLAGLPRGRRASALLAGALGMACPRTGFLVDEADRLGTIRRDSRRCWPQTELAKAWMGEAEAGSEVASAVARASLRRLADHYVGRPFDAGWTDCFAADGTVACDTVPASTLYHVFAAAAEADRVLDRTTTFTKSAPPRRPARTLGG
jgi:mannose/cellobiose epimerase-like protein (N-acyl-D-glucosamine 2-epimerase family)